MIRKKNYGFTLVELIVVIALMISLLVIAIVSFVSISDGKKEESWELVKEQIETAALDYFGSNEYLFEGLTSSGGANPYGAITVGKLVEEGYLSRVVNPMTNDVVDYCSFVKVTKDEDGTYNVKYNEEGSLGKNEYGECESSSIVYVSEPGGPTINPVSSCVTPGENGWCWDKAIINLNIETNNNGAVNDITTEGNNCTVGTDKKVTCDKEGVDSVKITAINTSGKKAIASANVKIDKTDPIISSFVVNSSNSKYKSNKVNGTVDASDATSGLKTIVINKKDGSDWLDFNDDLSNNPKEFNKSFTNKEISKELDGVNYDPILTVSDESGRKSTKPADYKVYDLCSNKKSDTSYGSWGKCSKSCGGGKQTRDVITKYTDAYTGASCGSDTAKGADSRTCNTNLCAATKCTVSSANGINTNCTSSAGNTVKAQIIIKCNGPIDYITMQYYYPDVTSDKICKGRTPQAAVCTQYPGANRDEGGKTNNCEQSVKANNKNGAVFNLLGCGVDRVAYRYKIVAGGKVIHDYGSYSIFNYNSEKKTNNKNVICDPGSTWFD